MIREDQFLDLVDDRLTRNLRHGSNAAQRHAITQPTHDILQIVAGPGSGKTTVLVLRALRHVLVEDILPEHVLITTFTRKAAQELRTRWLDWGTSLLDVLSSSHNVDHIDLNRCRIATLDSVVHDVLSEYRAAGTPAPILADNSASLLVLKRQVFPDLYWNQKEIIDELLSRYTDDRKAPRNQAEALRTAKRLLERLVQDQVDTCNYAQQGRAEGLIVSMLDRYTQSCIEANIFDFTTLENHFLSRLLNHHLREWVSSLRVMLVDEYQDTNSAAGRQSTSPLSRRLLYPQLWSETMTKRCIGSVVAP